MADTKISALTAKAAPVAADTAVIVDSVGGANKKITLGSIPIIPPLGTITTSATPYPSSDGSNTGAKVNHFTITALGAAAELQLPVGSWTDGEMLTIRILDDGTARALTYVASYRAIGTVLPATTTISKTLYLRCYYNSAATKWDVLGVSQEE